MTSPREIFISWAEGTKCGLARTRNRRMSRNQIVTHIPNAPISLALDQAKMPAQPPVWILARPPAEQRAITKVLTALNREISSCFRTMRVDEHNDLYHEDVEGLQNCRCAALVEIEEIVQGQDQDEQFDRKVQLFAWVESQDSPYPALKRAGDWIA